MVHLMSVSQRIIEHKELDEQDVLEPTAEQIKMQAAFMTKFFLAVLN